MQRITYIKDILHQYLEDGNKTYRKISEHEADSRLCAVKIRMGKIVPCKLCEIDTKYFTKTLLLAKLPVKTLIAVPKNGTISISLIGSRTLIICPIDVVEGGIGLFKIFTERIHR